MRAPLVNLFERFIHKKVYLGEKIKPTFDISMGYALTNLGGMISYTDIRQSDPLPRTALLGYTLSTGLDWEINNRSIKLFALDWSIEANDMLATRQDSITPAYQGMFGNIKIWDNLIKEKSDQNVEVFRGLRLSFFEFASIMWGSFNGPGWEHISTNGFSVRSSGMLKILNIDSKNATLFDHLDLQYSWSQHHTSTDDHPLDKTVYQSITLSLSGF